MTRSQRRLWFLFAAVPVLLLVTSTLYRLRMARLEGSREASGTASNGRLKR